MRHPTAACGSTQAVGNTVGNTAAQAVAPPGGIGDHGFMWGTLQRATMRHLPTLELIGVLTRITSFSVVSWLGADSPFRIVWVVNTLDAILLSWCSIVKKDRAYTLLNVFWIVIGVLGIVRAAPGH